MFRIVTAYAKNNKFSKIHPLEKALLCILPAFIIGFSSNFMLPAINIVMFLILHIIADNPLKLVFKLIGGVFLFTVFSSITFAFDYGIAYCLLVLVKCISGVCSLTFLMMTTPLDDFLNIFSRYEGLREICDIVKSMERFLILIEDEFLILNNSMKSRGGYDSFSLRVKNLSRVAGLLFINTLERWKEIRNALESRCYSGSTSYFYKSFSISKKRKYAICIYHIFLIMICIFKEW